MGIVYIRKSFIAGQHLAHLQNIAYAEVSLLVIDHGLVQSWSCNALTKGIIQNCITCLIALAAIGKLYSTKTWWLWKEGRLGLADPHTFSTLKVQRGPGTLNETLRLGAVHSRMEMQLPVLVYGALLPQVHPFEVTALSPKATKWLSNGIIHCMKDT